uniref:Uncharacterized protein n=1 Tax=Populus trichocarpa TaxID=3694 RepID=A0A2K1YAJ3_POPTR
MKKQNALDKYKIEYNSYPIHYNYFWLYKLLTRSPPRKRNLTRQVSPPTNFQNQTWFNAFFLQNNKGSHSWLFYFNNLIKTSNLPNWFLQWWDYFGCIYEVIKPHPLIENSYIYFKQKFKPSENEKKFPPILMFCFKLFVPWIYSCLADDNEDDCYGILPPIQKS